MLYPALKRALSGISAAHVLSRPHVTSRLTACNLQVNLHPRISTPHIKPVIMGTRARRVKASLLDDKIDILNRSAVEASPAQQVYRTVSAILALARVCTHILLPASASSLCDNQDKIADNGDSVYISEFCFDMCETLKAAIQGRNADDLGESVGTVLKDLERRVD